MSLSVSPTTVPAGDLPRWDMTVIYPSIDSPEFAAGFASVVDEIARLGELFDASGVGRRDPAPLDDATVAAVEEVLTRLNAVLNAVETLDAYLEGFVSTDSRNDQAQARASELDQQAVWLRTLGTRFDAWIGSLDVEALLARSSVARDHAFALRQAAIAASHQMSPEEERLAAELNPSAGSAWSK